MSFHQPTAPAVPAPAHRSAETPSDSSSLALLEEVRSLLPVLPILSAQVREVVRDVEQSVIGVCGNFQAMAAKARRAVAQTPLASDDSRRPGTDGGIPALVSNTRETLGHLLRRIEQSSEFSRLTVERMQSIEHEITSLLTNLHEIDEVAKSARILALNGQLEATRAGARGAAFTVVAKETANMAKHAVASSATIRRQIDLVAEGIEGASSELRDRAAADRQEAVRNREEILRTLDAMAALHREMERAMAESLRNNESLARDISAAVTALQFQDAVSQRLGHVAGAIDELCATLQTRVQSDESPSGAGAAPHRADRDWAARIAQKYTMESERAVLSAHAADRPAEPQSPGNNVELF